MPSVMDWRFNRQLIYLVPHRYVKRLLCAESIQSKFEYKVALKSLRNEK